MVWQGDKITFKLVSQIWDELKTKKQNQQEQCHMDWLYTDSVMQRKSEKDWNKCGPYQVLPGRKVVQSTARKDYNYGPTHLAFQILLLYMHSGWLYKLFIYD